MSPYGHALLTLALDAADDARADEAVKLLTASVAHRRGARRTGPSDRDPLLFDDVDTGVEATAWAVRAIAARHARLGAARAGGALADAQPPRRLVEHHQADRRIALDGVLTYMRARRDTGAVGTVEVVRQRPAGRHAHLHARVAGRVDAGRDRGAGGRGGQRRARRRPRHRHGALVGHGRVLRSVGGHASPGLERAGDHPRATPSSSRCAANGRIVYREVPIAGPLQTGDVVAVRLTVAGGGDWRYLLIEDPIPAGTEALPDRATPTRSAQEAPVGAACRSRSSATTTRRSSSRRSRTAAPTSSTC